jgi:predicted metal-binding membrane protein
MPAPKSVPNCAGNSNGFLSHLRSGFALAATLIQWMIERAGLLDSQMASASNALGSIVLTAVGLEPA